MVEEDKKRWYMVNTYVGRGNRVKENLLRRVKSMRLQDYPFRVIVTEEKEIEYRNGKEVKKTTNLFSGYLFAEVTMTGEARYVVRSASGVTEFTGSSGGGAKPFPVVEGEMENILRRLGMSERKVQIDFAVGGRVCILSGTFANAERIAEELHEGSQAAAVLTILFGCKTPMETGYGELEKVEL